MFRFDCNRNIRNESHASDGKEHGRSYVRNKGVKRRVWGRGSEVEAIGRVYCPIAWLPPGHDPGAGVGVALLPGSGPLWRNPLLEFSAEAMGARAVALVACVRHAVD